jgi:hypothetical protein
MVWLYFLMIRMINPDHQDRSELVKKTYFASKSDALGNASAAAPSLLFFLLYAK